MVTLSFHQILQFEAYENYHDDIQIHIFVYLHYIFHLFLVSIHKNHQIDIQLDYTNKISETQKVEAGYKGSISREKSPTRTYSGLTAEDAVLDERLYNDFSYNQDIHALYLSYSSQIDNFGYQVLAKATSNLDRIAREAYTTFGNLEGSQCRFFG